MNAAKSSALKLHSLVVRARTGACERCGVRGLPNAEQLPVIGLEAAHVIPRTYANTCTDERNGVALCRDCHRRAHADPIEFLYWWIETAGGRRLWDELWARANNTRVRVDFAVEVARLRQSLHQLRRAA